MREHDKSLEGMLEFGHLQSLADLPAPREFARLAAKAVKLVDTGTSPPPRPKPQPDRALAIPDDLDSALAKNRKARAAFDAFSYSCRKEYVKWIEEARREETRAQRVAKTVAQAAEGKKLYWRYER
jgi:uncharacterized protein YdeI (YjbR/CyaY-like superfamily)